MKPRLRLKFHVWSCVSWHGDRPRCGYGYDPESAYLEWLREGARR